MGVSRKATAQFDSRCWIRHVWSSTVTPLGRAVSNDLFHNNEKDTTAWLENLDTTSVSSTFKSSNSSTRLGEHFAKCVEFVLRYSPAFKLESLFYSVQVLKTVSCSPEELHVEQAVNLNHEGDKYENRRARKLLEKLKKKERRRRTIVQTIGEFDFLFQQKLVGEEEQVTVDHWEVSVKYLLYVGPWEAFGFQTPGHSKWTRIRTDTGNDISDRENKDKFLGWFLGPHVGETLADRKHRLANQLTLSTNSSALQTVSSLFKTDKNNMRLHSRALLKGYLFYEYGLWQLLKTDDVLNNNNNSTYQTSLVNKAHWKGWWMDLQEFVACAWDPGSRWYIVPKKEWLSPVVVDETLEKERARRLLSRQELVDMALKVAAEAPSDRMRRFLVAELQPSSSAWTEVSRGFLVEDTWPDTKLYSPYGFVTH